MIKLESAYSCYCNYIEEVYGFNDAALSYSKWLTMMAFFDCPNLEEKCSKNVSSHIMLKPD